MVCFVLLTRWFVRLSRGVIFRGIYLILEQGYFHPDRGGSPLGVYNIKRIVGYMYTEFYCNAEARMGVE